MAEDIVERLRVRRGAQGHPMGGHDGWCDLTDPEKLEAADEIERMRTERIALLSAGLALRIEVDGLKAELKRAKADLYVATYPDDAYLRDYGDGSWQLIGDDGIILDWHDGIILDWHDRKEVSDD